MDDDLEWDEALLAQLDSAIERHEGARPQPAPGDIRSFFCAPSSKRPRTSNPAELPADPAGGGMPVGPPVRREPGRADLGRAPEAGPVRAAAAGPSDAAPDDDVEPDDRPPQVALDEAAAETWVYPTNMPLRAYQHSISKTALLHNTLVGLPRPRTSP